MEKQEQKKLRYHTFKARCKKKKNNRNRKVYKKEVQMKKTSAQSIGAHTKDLLCYKMQFIYPFMTLFTDLMIFLLRETPLLWLC